MLRTRSERSGAIPASVSGSGRGAGAGRSRGARPASGGRKLPPEGAESRPGAHLPWCGLPIGPGRFPELQTEADPISAPAERAATPRFSRACRRRTEAPPQRGWARDPAPLSLGIGVRRAAFTLIELCIAVVLVGVLFTKLTLLFNEASQTHRRESQAMALEDQARTVLDRIAFAVIGTDRDALNPNNQSPFWTSKLEYQLSMGVEDGEVVWGAPEVIGLDDLTPSELYWAKNQGEPGEQIVTWCRTVAEFFANEIANGDDDNDNGLTDEVGLNFSIEGNRVRIQLTLERVTKEGTIRHTDETVVTCRN